MLSCDESSDACSCPEAIVDDNLMGKAELAPEWQMTRQDSPCTDIDCAHRLTDMKMNEANCWVQMYSRGRVGVT